MLTPLVAAFGNALAATRITNDAEAAAFGSMFTAASYRVAVGYTHTGVVLELAINDILGAGNDAGTRIIDI